MADAPASENRVRFHGRTAIRTSPEVWAVLRARHHDDMVVYGTFSDPDGEMSGRCTMETTYALRGASYLFIGARTTWDRDPEKDYGRVNERHEYFIFVAQGDVDD